MVVREFPGQARRVETGPIRFGDDWTGVFIRGDNAFSYALHLEAIIADLKFSQRVALGSLLDELKSCDERTGDNQ